MTDEYFFTSCFIFNRSQGGSPRKSGDSDSGASGNPRTQLAEHLPVIAISVVCLPILSVVFRAWRTS